MEVLFHTINHCLSSKSTSWDQIPTNIATVVVCLTSNQKYNFSKLIFDGMLRHLDAKKKFVMYPHFISIFLDKQLANVSVPLDHFPVNTLTSKVFSFMVKKGKHFSGKVTPLFATMLVQPTQDEGASSERPSEVQPTPSLAPTSKVPHEPQTDSSPAQTSEVPIEQQTDLSPRPSPTTTIPDSIPETSGGNLGGHSSSDKSLSGNEGDMTLQSVYDLCLSLCAQSMDEECLLEAKISKKEILKETMVHRESVSKQGRKFAKVDEEKRMQKMYLSTAQHKLPSDDNAREGTKEWEDEEERNRLAEEEATNNALIRNYNDIKARIKADRLLAEKLQEEEREQFIIKKSNILHDTICSSRNIPGFNKDLKLSGTNHLQKNQTEKSNG
ncbi:hypothetical protein Tco_0875406 [Tanacetum coccineum]|uniref:Uncharacterized protein n=1 Tax=Tanacetum coccineum TaxID=301880 RepID=A0ABQ5BPI6_9ASTR